jgi:hypothetical protein
LYRGYGSRDVGISEGLWLLLGNNHKEFISIGC